MKFIAFCFALAISGSCFADFPDRPIKIITNLPVGAAPEVVARKIAGPLSLIWKQPVIIENRPGAGGLVALEHYLKTPNDSHTILMADFGAHVSMPILYNKEELMQELKTVWPMLGNYWVIATPPHIKNWTQLQQQFKSNPNFGSWGVGSAGHLCGTELSSAMNIKAQHIPYKEFSSWLTELSASTTTLGCTTIGSSEQYVKAGRLNLLAITADKRDPAFPDLPTVSELIGRPFLSKGGWVVFFTHKKTNEAQRKTLQDAIQFVLQMPDVQKDLERIRVMTWKSDLVAWEKDRAKVLTDYKALVQKFDIKIQQ